MDVLMAHRWPGNIRELKNVIERLVLKANGQLVGRPTCRPTSSNRRSVRRRPQQRRRARRRKRRRARRRTSWPCACSSRANRSGRSVYPVFMSRDLTRDDLRKIVQIGLESTNGNYRLLIQLFNMPDEDYKRFLSFLRKHDCHLPFQRFRVAPSRLPAKPSVARSSTNKG